MTAQSGSQRKKLAAPLKETMAATEKSNVEAKTPITRTRVKKRAQPKPAKLVEKSQKALQSAQAKAKYERQARLKAEKALAEAQASLAAARLAVEQEHQRRVKRVSFVVRLTVDEHSQLGRTEIEHVESSRKQNFFSLDGERLVIFMKECVSPVVISEPAVPTAPSRVPSVQVVTPKPEDAMTSRETLPAPSGDARHSTGAVLTEQALALPRVAKRRRAKKNNKHHRRQKPKPSAPQNTMLADRPGDSAVFASRPRRPQASLIVSTVRVFRPGEPELATLFSMPEEPFIVQARFHLQGTEARSLAAQGSSYYLKIYANELTSGKSQLLTTCSAELVQDVLEYTAPAEVSGLPPGLYRLSTVVTLAPLILMAGFHSKAILYVT